MIDLDQHQKYEKRSSFATPTLLSMMLNTSVEGIHANEKFTFYLTD